jgi:phenylalanyl-tRNA synthetase alpha chain
MNSLPALENARAEAERLFALASPAEAKAALLGKTGIASALLRETATIEPENRAEYSAAVQALKAEWEGRLKPTEERQNAPLTVDMSVPAGARPTGGIHPISAMIEEMTGIFRDLSFEVVEGPEIVQDKENFEYLNIGVNHPARDGHDSFYLDDVHLLRTQTTAVQVLEMQRRVQSGRFPIRVVVPGKTYRREADQTHSAMFHQFDAVVVDTQTTFADLRGTLDFFAKRLFGDQVETRFRPHHFPFTEPSAEMDIRWKGGDASQGKHAGWLEFGGCGMIHPDVLKRAGINPRVYQGWAFGMSVERPIMVRRHVPDIRLLTTNAVTTLDQLSVRP